MFLIFVCSLLLSSSRKGSYLAFQIVLFNSFNVYTTLPFNYNSDILDICHVFWDIFHCKYRFYLILFKLEILLRIKIQGEEVISRGYVTQTHYVSLCETKLKVSQNAEPSGWGFCAFAPVVISRHHPEWVCSWWSSHVSWAGLCGQYMLTVQQQGTLGGSLKGTLGCEWCTK